MRKGIVVGLVVLAVCSCLSLLNAEEKGKNLAPNASFEQGEGNKVIGWAFWAWAPKGVKATSKGIWDNTVAHTGTHSLKIQGTEAKQVGDWDNKHGGELIPVEEGKVYTVSVWIKTQTIPNEGVVKRFGIGFYDEQSQGLKKGGKTYKPDLTGENDWTQVRFFIRTPEKAKFARIDFSFDGIGSAWFDDVEVIETSSLSDQRQWEEGVISFKAPGLNVALGKTYEWNVKPTYKHCSDSDDAKQLTDGKYVPGCNWTKEGTVGWNQMRELLSITIDLGQVEPITGLSYNTTAGSAGIYWPNAIVILVSDDGKTFYNAGELTELSALHAAVPVSGVHRYYTDRLATYGRYVRLLISASSYIFCDEIEIYRGDDKLLKQSHVGSPVTDVKQFILKNATRTGIRKRMLGDIADMKKSVANSSLLPSQKQNCLKRLKELIEPVMKLEIANEKTFRCILPLNSLHAEVYAVNAPLLRAQGVKNFTVWHTCRWDPLAPLDVPAGQTGTLTIRAMRGEYRAETLNLTNPADRTKNVLISFKGLPESPTPDWIEPHEVLYTDSLYGRVIADALKPLSPNGGAYKLTIPAGMTKQIWLRFHPTTTPPGKYEGEIILATETVTRSVPLRVHISKIRFPKQVRCTQLLCDYSDSPSYDFKILGDAGIDVAIKNMQEHFVNQTWAHAGAAAIPNAGYYNDKHELIKPLNWARFDRWVQRWGGTPRYYVVFLAFKGERFAGTTMGTSAFDARLSVWTAAWRKHVIDIGLNPGEIAVLVFDEYSTDEQAANILGWVKPIKAGYPEIKILETCNQARPDQSKVQELYDITDIFSPSLAIYEKGGKPVADFYARQVARGAELWTYQNGLIENSDPYWHHRLQEWRCWNNGMTGTGFWAYCDAGNGGSWNPYVTTMPRYSPVYIGPGTIMDGKHWEAIREGIQDYEYLALLRDRLMEAEKQGYSAALISRAKKILAEVPKKVFHGDTWAHGVWWTPKDRTGADREIAKVMEALESLNEK
ncbi:MAG: carbohydrate binding domain-containing protein [bacterium]